MKLFPRAPEEQEETAEPVRPGPKRIEEPAERPPPSKRRRSRRGLVWLAALATLLLVAIILYPHLDEYLRRTLEAKIDQQLTGYTATLAGAHLSPFGLALALEGVVIRQDAHPDPPVVNIPRLESSVEWRQLLRLRLVANAVFDRLRVHVNLPQLRQEDRDQIDIQDRGWQDALAAIYPLKLNTVEVWDGELVYVDRDPRRPFEISRWNLIAENIRNVRSEEGVYPSPVRSEGILFGSGRGIVVGHADFLSKPFPGIQARYRLERVPLERLGVLSSRANLELKGGVLASNGTVEYSPRHREAHLADVTVRGLRLDYLHTAATAGAEKKRAAKVSRAALDDRPPMLVRVDRVHLAQSVLGLVQRPAGRSPYRVYLDGADLSVTNLSSGFQKGPARARLTGRFMGSGATRASATFREPADGPDFDLNVAIEGASLPAMNDLLRSHGKLDVTAGSFSVYSEVKVKNRRIDGYVKPLIKDVKVYDSKQDKDKPVLKKLYEKIAGGLSKILENRPREEVATVADLSGSIDDPDTSIWDIVVRLVSNAFVKAILPGFEREFEAARRGR